VQDFEVPVPAWFPLISLLHHARACQAHIEWVVVLLTYCPS